MARLTLSPDDWRKFYEQEFRPLFRYVLAATRDTAETEDIVQEAFLRLSRWTPDRDHHIPRQWLFKVARNLVIDRGRRCQRLGMPGPQQGKSDPERAAADTELRRRVVQCIQQLPTIQRECLSLREFGEFTYAEIAAQLGISLDQVKVQIHRARIRLREELKEFT